jgi:hypothetical protein
MKLLALHIPDLKTARAALSTFMPKPIDLNPIEVGSKDEEIWRLKDARHALLNSTGVSARPY